MPRNFPFYKNYPRGIPPYRIYQPNIYNNTYSSKDTLSNNSFSNRSLSTSIPLEDFSKKDVHEDFRQKNKSNRIADNCLFDLFGLKIYYDDILLISLIYFLYSEGVKDDGLFIVLILLLLS